MRRRRLHETAPPWRRRRDHVRVHASRERAAAVSRRCSTGLLGRSDGVLVARRACDGVNATPHRRGAVDAAAWESTRVASMEGSRRREGIRLGARTQVWEGARRACASSESSTRSIRTWWSRSCRAGRRRAFRARPSAAIPSVLTRRLFLTLSELQVRIDVAVRASTQRRRALQFKKGLRRVALFHDCRR